MHRYDYSFLKTGIPGSIAGLTDISVKTVELVLGKMLKERRIIKIGTFKDARYMKNNEG